MTGKRMAGKTKISDLVNAMLDLHEKVTEDNKKDSDSLPIDPKELIAEIDRNPDYFLMEGGSDGTFGHAEFCSLYGRFKPEIIKFAVACGGKVWDTNFG